MFMAASRFGSTLVLVPQLLLLLLPQGLSLQRKGRALPSEEKGEDGFARMHCSLRDHQHLQGLRRIWCKQSSELCCEGLVFNSNTKELQGGNVIVRHDDYGNFTVFIRDLRQGEGMYWCGLLDTQDTIIKLAESYLSLDRNQWDILRWVLGLLLFLVVPSIHLYFSYHLSAGKLHKKTAQQVPNDEVYEMVQCEPQ